MMKSFPEALPESAATPRYASGVAASVRWPTWLCALANIALRRAMMWTRTGIVLDRAGLKRRTCKSYATVMKEYDRLLPAGMAI
jgi:hypothetical protein